MGVESQELEEKEDMVVEPADKVIPNIFILHLRGCPDSTPWDTTISHAALTL